MHSKDIYNQATNLRGFTTVVADLINKKWHLNYHPEQIYDGRQFFTIEISVWNTCQNLY